jgi:hypothetical protein
MRKLLSLLILLLLFAAPASAQSVVGWVDSSANNTQRASGDRYPLPVQAGRTIYVDVTLSLDTSAYASGDVLADTQVITNMVARIGYGGVLQSVEVIDEDDQGAAFTIYFLDANVAMGTENSAPSISDANARSITGSVAVATSDYADLGGVKVAKISGGGLPLQAASGTRNGYVAVVNSTGTPTYTASGVRLRLGILQD